MIFIVFFSTILNSLDNYGHMIDTLVDKKSPISRTFIFLTLYLFSVQDA